LLGEVEKAGGFYINFYFKNIEYDDGFYGDEFSSHNSNVYCEFLYDRKAQEFIDIWNMASNHQDDYWPQEVAELLTRGWEVYTVDEVRVEHEAETRRMWLPRGKRTRLHVDRTRSARSFFGALSLTTKKMKIYPIEGNQNAEQITLAMARLVRETENDKIAVVLDNAGFHHAKAVTDLYEPGQALERIKPIYLPPYAPDHNPTEHVWNAAKAHISNIQQDTPEQTYSAFTNYITSRTFDYDFEHLPITPSEGNLV